MWSQIEYWVKNEDKLADEESETRVYSLWEVIREVFHRFCRPGKKTSFAVPPKVLNTFHCDASLWYQSRMCVDSWTYLTDQQPHTKTDAEFHIPSSAYVNFADGTRNPTSLANVRAKINQCKAKIKTLHLLTCDSASELSVLATQLRPRIGLCPYDERYIGLFQRIFEKVEVFVSYWGDRFFICEHTHKFSYRDEMLTHSDDIIRERILPAFEPLRELDVVENAQRTHDDMKEAFAVWLSLHAY